MAGRGGGGEREDRPKPWYCMLTRHERQETAWYPPPKSTPGLRLTLL